MNVSAHEIFRDGEAVHLTTQEFKLLRYLLQNRGKTVTREQLLRDAWDITAHLDTRTTDRHIASLRKRLEPSTCSPSYIETIFGRGHRFRR